MSELLLIAFQPLKNEKETTQMVQFLQNQSKNFDLNVNNQTAWALCETFHRDLRAETHSEGLSYV